MELDRVRQLSKLLRWIAAIIAFNIIVWTLAHIVRPTSMAAMIQDSFGDISANGLPLIKHINLSILLALAVLPTLRALQMLWRLFTLYANGIILNEKAATTLKSIGRAVLMMAGAALVAPTIAVLLLTFDNPPGQRQFVIDYSTSVFALALCGGLILTIGWAMVEAARVDADNKAIV